tara:strand:- start:70 stop:297 length:228 start_codon:yes stop_codon:yes gene_type:complete
VSQQIRDNIRPGQWVLFVAPFPAASTSDSEAGHFLSSWPVRRTRRKGVRGKAWSVCHVWILPAFGVADLSEPWFP